MNATNLPRCVDTLTKDEISDELGEIADILCTIIPEGQNARIDDALIRLWLLASRVRPENG